MVKDEVVVGILTVDYLHSKTVVGESDDVNHRKEDKKVPGGGGAAPLARGGPGWCTGWGGEVKQRRRRRARCWDALQTPSLPLLLRRQRPTSCTVTDAHARVFSGREAAAAPRPPYYYCECRVNVAESTPA